jgi:NAD(P)-dependent dehydrogenase (short-subunit alcohol dehydrogenase family)
MDVSDLNGRTAVVTGAASGIGKETALAMARRGARLAICDVNETALDGVAAQLSEIGEEPITRVVDVSKLDEVKAFADAVHAEVPAVDILVNNAGVGLGGNFSETTMEDWHWILGINLWGVIHGCHCFLPAMVDRGGPRHVVNISSVAGFMPSDALTAYVTTKFAVLGLSESLRDELLPHGIGVTAVCPGFINTPITEHARVRGPAADPELRQRTIDFYKRRNYGPERVAKNILRAIQRDRSVAPVSPEAWAFYFMKRFLPRQLAWINRTTTHRMRREAEKRAGEAQA